MLRALRDEDDQRVRRSQTYFSEWIAELREHHRLLHMFPFYQRRARNELGEQLTDVLKLACNAIDLPDGEVGWRMAKPQFEDLLRRIAIGMGAPSVDDALNTSHVNRLHYKWLDLALAKNFDFKPRPEDSVELDLGQSLKRAGSLVRIKWMNVKPYEVGNIDASSRRC